jgi:exonuclease SbcC
MRPLSITLSGVRSYIGTCGPLDFTQRSLVGILGDTGAGKSTLLEAIPTPSTAGHPGATTGHS